MAGVDGCRGGWVVVTGAAEAGGAGPVRVDVVPSLEDVVGRTRRGELAVVALDMPIGLPEAGPRSCDVEARALLGPRRSSVFPAPVRAVLGAADYEEACRRSRRVSGRALSRQAFHLLPKVAEVDRLLAGGGHDGIVESHPELAFLRLAGGRPLEAKRTEAGRRQRVELVRDVLGADPDELARAGRAPLGDLLDAAALLATARHLAAGTARILGGAPDAVGRPMRIAW